MHSQALTVIGKRKRIVRAKAVQAIPAAEDRGRGGIDPDILLFIIFFSFFLFLFSFFFSFPFLSTWKVVFASWAASPEWGRVWAWGRREGVFGYGCRALNKTIGRACRIGVITDARYRVFLSLAFLRSASYRLMASRGRSDALSEQMYLGDLNTGIMCNGTVRGA